MGFMDCDSHVLEVPQTWDYLDPGEEHFRPQIARFEDGAAIRLGARAQNEGLPRTPSQLFFAGDSWTRFVPAHGAMSPHVNMYEPGMLDLTDPAARIEALDALGIDVQVLFSTFYIGMELDNPLEEAALARSYNRWVVEHDMFLCDPYFFPLYERAQDLNLPILIHNGATIRLKPGIPIGNFTPQPPTLMHQLVNLMCAFHAVLGSDVAQRFPRLRWGFLEGGAAFTLPVLQQHARRDMSIGVRPFLDPRQATPGDIEAMNMYVAVETDEDLPYLAGSLGQQNLIVGTDFGHNDLGSELGAHQTVQARPDVGAGLATAITDTNARRLLDLDPAYRPAPAKPAPGDLPHVHAAAGGPAITVPSWVRQQGRS